MTFYKSCQVINGVIEMRKNINGLMRFFEYISRTSIMPFYRDRSLSLIQAQLNNFKATIDKLKNNKRELLCTFSTNKNYANNENRFPENMGQSPNGHLQFKARKRKNQFMEWGKLK